MQQYINELASVDGIVGEGDPNAKSYSSNNYIADGDNRKEAIGKLDAQAKVNADGISDVIDRLNAGEYIIKAYADDASYEAENGLPPYTDLTGIYYNTTDGVLKYYDNLNSEWSEIGSGGVGAHEALGFGNGVQANYDLALLPNDENSFMVFINGVYQDQSKYSFTVPTITFNTAPALGQKIDVFMLTQGKSSLSPIAAGSLVVEYITLDATAITNKEITLPSAPPLPTKVMVDVIHGSAQIYGVDYSVSADILTWDALGLESEVTSGTILRVFYIS